jgi:hypothetical protein
MLIFLNKLLLNIIVFFFLIKNSYASCTVDGSGNIEVDCTNYTTITNLTDFNNSKIIYGEDRGIRINNHIINNLVNQTTGEIRGSEYGIVMFTDSEITLLENSGVIESSSLIANSAIVNFGSYIGSINNQSTGLISGPIGIVNNSGGGRDTVTIGTITNYGVIRGTYSHGISNEQRTINQIINYGDISTVDQYQRGIYNYPGARINLITNTGNINNIYNGGIIEELNNLQSNLAYGGNLPFRYKIIIESPSSYGQIQFSGCPSAHLEIGIYPGSVVSAGTYQNVINGINNSCIISSLEGVYGDYNYSFVLDDLNYYDLIFSLIRSPYNSRITSSNLTTFATHLETMRTNGRKVALTAILDDLTDDQFNTVLKKMKGATSNITNNQALNAQSNFRTAASIMTSPVATSKVTNLTKSNTGNLTLADLKNNQLHASIQSAKFLTDNNFFNQETNQSSINVLEFFKSNRNTSIIDKDFNERGFYLKTFGSTSNYAAINNDDNGYNSDTYGFFGGISNKIDENLYQGYSLGFSRSKLTLDADEGNSKTNTIHASIHRNMDDKEYALGASLGAYISSVDNIRNISETSEVLKSSPTNGGLDLQLEYVKKMNLFGLNFYPSVSLTTSYGIIEDYREAGGVGSALHVKSDNVLVIKPEIGFTLENNFVQTEKITQGANFSLFASRQQYLDGHSTTTSLIDENFSNSNTLPKTKNHFLTAGIGYIAKNIDEKSDLNLNFFYTQSTNNSLNSSLFSISYNKTF